MDLYGLLDAPWSTEDPPNLLQLCRGCLISATLLSLAAATPLDVITLLAYCGNIDEARGYASLNESTERRFLALSRVAQVLVERRDPSARDECIQRLILAGDRTNWRETLAGAEEDLEESSFLEESAMELESIAAIALSEVGVEDEAAQLVQRFLDEYEKMTRCRFAIALVNIGRIDEARQLAYGLAQAGGESNLNDALRRRIAELLAKAGDMAAALKVLAPVSDPSDVLPTLIDAASETASLQGTASVPASFWSEASSGIPTAEDRATMLSHIAQALHAKGETSSAIHVSADALWAVRRSSRSTLFNVMKNSADVIGCVRRGELLGQVYDSVIRTDAWW